MHNGVDRYVWAEMRIPFPAGEVECWGCPLLDTDILKRYYCRRTGEYISVPKAGVGRQCPLEFGEEDGNAGETGI